MRLALALVVRVAERWTSRALRFDQYVVAVVRVGVRGRLPSLEGKSTSAVSSRPKRAGLRGIEICESDDAHDHQDEKRHDDHKLDRDDTMVVTCAGFSTSGHQVSRHGGEG
jgi:hypothetical protein